MELQNVIENLSGIKRLADEAKQSLESFNVDNSLLFLTPRKLSELTGMSLQTARRLFNRPDFPAQCFAKEKFVSLFAFLKFCEKKHDD